MFDEIKDFILFAGWAGVLVVVLTCGVIGLIGVLVADSTFAAERQTLDVVVIEKTYTPGETGVAVGNVPQTGNGGGGPVVVVTSKSQKWEVVVNLNGDYRTISTSPDVYYQLEEGQRVNLSCNVGKIIGMISSCSVE